MKDFEDLQAFTVFDGELRDGVEWRTYLLENVGFAGLTLGLPATLLLLLSAPHRLFSGVVVGWLVVVGGMTLAVVVTSVVHRWRFVRRPARRLIDADVAAHRLVVRMRRAAELSGKYDVTQLANRWAVKALTVELGGELRTEVFYDLAYGSLRGLVAWRNTLRRISLAEMAEVRATLARLRDTDRTEDVLNCLEALLEVPAEKRELLVALSATHRDVPVGKLPALALLDETARETALKMLPAWGGSVEELVEVVSTL